MPPIVTVGQKENLSQISIAIQFAVCVNVKKQIAKPRITKLKRNNMQVQKKKKFLHS